MTCSSDLRTFSVLSLKVNTVLGRDKIKMETRPRLLAYHGVVLKWVYRRTRWRTPWFHSTTKTIVTQDWNSAGFGFMKELRQSENVVAKNCHIAMVARQLSGQLDSWSVWTSSCCRVRAAQSAWSGGCFLSWICATVHRCCTTSHNGQVTIYCCKWYRSWSVWSAQDLCYCT